MSFPDLLAIGGLFFSGIIFILLANRAKGKKFSIIGYTQADKEIESGAFGSSLVAAATSLATVVIFFLSNAKYFGIILLWCGVTYIIGQYIFIRFITKNRIVEKELGNQNSKTISDIWYNSFNSKFIARVISIITFSSFTVILFIEIFFGSQLLTYFIPDTIDETGIIAFIILSIFIIGYVRLGGLKAVMQTDRWQMKLLITSVVALFVASLIIADKPIPAQTNWNLMSFEADTTSIIVFCIWILVFNIAIPWGQLSSWQRISASKTDEQVWKGFTNNIFNFLIVWILPVLGFVIFLTKGYEFSDLATFFNTLKSSNGLISEILYPLIVIGFGSALFSTADTAVVALGTTLLDKNTFGDYFSKKSDVFVKRFLTLFSVAILFLIGLLFFIAKVDVGAWFLKLIFNIFGQLSIIAPFCYYAFLYKKSEQININSIGLSIIIAGLLISWFLNLYSTFLGESTGLKHITEIVAVSSILLSVITLKIGLKISGVR